jgi:hypothetical protein
LRSPSTCRFSLGAAGHAGMPLHLSIGGRANALPKAAENRRTPKRKRPGHLVRLRTEHPAIENPVTPPPRSRSRRRCCCRNRCWR